jgi:hypothetical protein
MLREQFALDTLAAEVRIMSATAKGRGHKDCPFFSTQTPNVTLMSAF